MNDETGSLKKLQESKDRFMAEQRDAGRTAGEKWAEEAEFEDVRRLQKLYGCSVDDDFEADADDVAPGDPAEVFGDDWRELETAYVGGFVKGALDAMGLLN